MQRCVVLTDGWFFATRRWLKWTGGCNPMLTFKVDGCFMLVMSDANKALLEDLLKATSRSFYLNLTLRVRP
jgi:hypothetical protein